MKIITTAIIKGGTGKTATATALAQAAAAEGKKVLAIDLDPQANFSFSLKADLNQPGTFELLTGTPAAEVIQTTPQGIDTIIGSSDLIGIHTSTGSAMRLQRALEPIKKDYNIIIMDTPPTMGELTFNALQAAEGLIIPLEADSNSLQGLYHIVGLAKQMQNSNPRLKILGVIITRYDGRPNINKYLKSVIEEKGTEIGAPLLGAVRNGVAVREAIALQQSLFEYAPNSKPAMDYMQIYVQLFDKKQKGDLTNGK